MVENDVMVGKANMYGIGLHMVSLCTLYMVIHMPAGILDGTAISSAFSARS